MGRKGQATRGRIIGVGLDCLSIEGLSGVTIGMLASKAGMSTGGFVGHFSSKEKFLLELLDEMQRINEAIVIAPTMALEPGLNRLSELFYRWLGWPSKAGLSGGCPFAAVLFKLDDLTGPVRDRVVELETNSRRLLERLVSEAIDRGELDNTTDPVQMAWEITGIYLAHHASSRLARDKSSDKRAKTSFEALLARAGAKKGRY